MAHEVEIKKIMETDESGVQRQVFPETHVSAVLGLDKIETIGTGVTSINGKTGDITLTAKDLDVEGTGITIEKVGTV
ncbi:hypothetical protein ATZ33_17205 [Enterococcus silesiacus]|uniref:Uncharacterized protein n=1 Tax=Enterococcus silesiacus TaxID=332949 RepID=A0A0S3KFJ3_9ENTE|nr:hypothetical protein [Enterococcus silesiacus]ALS03053.1 hypothetical protein ATZ33_17205 [Enterococcus silesiacus]OJG92998.1 hypothetical protein RV15_GL002132 [Enterococcus silesiacus]